MSTDPLWPSAASWIRDCTERYRRGQQQPPVAVQMALLGVPAHRTSLSASRADTTPGAVRAALARFSVHGTSHGLDLRELTVVDIGDVDDPDGPGGEQATAEVVSGLPRAVTMALGGDNSITVAVARGSGADGLITLDAHHDLRDGRSNGSPVRRLIEGGLDGRRVVQIGISDYTNSPAHAARARDLGITVITRTELERRPVEDAMSQALEIAGAGGRGRIHVDLDVDVCDRSVAPACPASAPGGLSAHQLRTAARSAAADPRVVSLDLTEVDATQDAADGRTVRLAALCVLETAAGVLLRPGRGSA